MFSTFGEGVPGNSAGHNRVSAADGETFEIRYVDAAEAASWARERGHRFGEDDITPAVMTYLD